MTLNSAHLLISANYRMERFRKNDPWVILNKITSSSMSLSEGNRHSFRICLAKYMLFTGREVRMGKNCARGLEYGPRPKAGYELRLRLRLRARD